MKCQKCGATLASGHLYCDICGAEYQIVPDFEPEIEKSIAESLFDISTSLKEKDKDVKSTDRKSLKDRKVPSFTLILAIVFIFAAFLFLGISKYKNGTFYKNKQAMEAVQISDYYKASQIYHDIRKKNNQDVYWYIKEAEVKMMLGEEDVAYNLALSALELPQNSEYAYEFLFSYLEEQKNYIKLMEYLKRCEYEHLREKYWEFLCVVPRPSYESGTYNEAIEISFDKEYLGNIYYTLDGTQPTKNSQKYEESIKIGNGNHILNVVYENPYNFLGDAETFEYQIISDTPMAPIVSVSSGNYVHGTLIEVAVETGTRVFYTTDLTSPTMESLEYTQPIPMPLGESNFNFIAISEKGNESDITQRNFMLNLKTGITLEEAEIKIVQKLIATGHILDKNGAIQDRYGVFRYFYKYPISETEIDYYVFEEHYLENQINNPLQNFYAVDVLYGNVYKLISDGEGNFTRVEF